MQPKVTGVLFTSKRQNIGHNKESRSRPTFLPRTFSVLVRHSSRQIRCESRSQAPSKKSLNPSRSNVSHGENLASKLPLPILIKLTGHQISLRDGIGNLDSHAAHIALQNIQQLGLEDLSP